MSELQALALFLPMSLFSGFVRGLTGFGGPLILIPAMAFFISPVSATATAVVVDMWSNVTLLRQAIRNASRNTVILLALSSGLAIPMGGWVLLTADPEMVKRILYIAVGIAALILLTGWRFPRPMKPVELLGGGALAGLVMGSTGLGIIIVPVLFSMPEAAATSRANLVVWVFLMSVLLGSVLALGGGFGTTELIRGLALAPAYLLGTWLGQKAFGRIDEKAFRTIILVFLLIFSGVGLVFG
ncbi:MAG: sulfite exporter TauE/SafE family protein [Hyphomicrobiales bacterium]